MKIIKLHNRESQLIALAQKNNRRAQEQLYTLFSPKMLRLCNNYVKDRQEAESVMLEGFFKVFTKINSYKNKGSFEGWIRQIMVWDCISFLRKKHALLFSDALSGNEVSVNTSIESEFAVAEIQTHINELPEGARVVFNLYIIEGYKHKEIADLLNITEGTSKTQLSRARKALQHKIMKPKKTCHETK